MKNNHYPIQFQAQYEQTAEKILAITKKYQAKIINSQPLQQQLLETHLDMIQDQISEKELVFRKQSIYSQFASGQVMAEKRKNPPELCPECGEEIKKIVQCQFCAEAFCIKCCSRKRVIPFVSKDFRLCCEQCHWKFVKLFDNKHFYEEKQALTNAINHLKTKTTKIKQKLEVKRTEVEKVKSQRRSQKIKQKNLQGKIMAQQKKLKALQQQYRRVIGEKAQKIKQEQRRKRLQQQERQKAKKAQEQRSRKQQLQIKQQEKRRLQVQKRRKQEQQLKRKQEQKSKPVPDRSSTHKAEAKHQQQLSDSLRKKQQQLKRRQQELLQRQLSIKRKLQEQFEQKHSNNSNLSSKPPITPKQSVDRISVTDQKGGKFHLQTNDTISQKRSRKESEEMNSKNEKNSNKSSNLDNLQKIIRVQLSQSAKQHKKSLAEPLKKDEVIEKLVEQEKVFVDPLQKSLANMLKPKKDEQLRMSKKDDDMKSMSIYSNQSKSILDMNVNDLLSIRIPTVPNSLKVSNQQQRGDRLSVEALNNRQEQSVSPLRLSRKVTVQQPLPQVPQVQMDRQAIIRNNASLITSNKQTITSEPQVTPSKCACQIM